MSKLPRPPAAPLGLSPDTHPLPVGTLLWRIFATTGRYPSAWNQWRTFGPTKARFDHHLDPPQVQSRAILYGADEIVTCFAEFFQERRVINRTRHDPCLAAFRTARPLALLDLTDTWPTRAGASMAISTGPRSVARLWSRRWYDDYPDIDGLWYGSSMYGNRPCVALYERATDAAPAHPEFHRLVRDSTMLPVVQDAARRLNYRVVPFVS